MDSEAMKSFALSRYHPSLAMPQLSSCDRWTTMKSYHLTAVIVKFLLITLIESLYRGEPAPEPPIGQRFMCELTEISRNTEESEPLRLCYPSFFFSRCRVRYRFQIAHLGWRKLLFNAVMGPRRTNFDRIVHSRTVSSKRSVRIDTYRRLSRHPLGLALLSFPNQMSVQLPSVCAGQGVGIPPSTSVNLTDQPHQG
jgi:hypothetical protein